MDQLYSTTEDQGTLEPATQDQPVERLVQVRYQGDIYEMPETLAIAWRKREEEFNRKLSEQGQELGQLRQRTTAPVATQPATPTAQEADLQFFTSPTQALQSHFAQFRDELRREQDQQRALEARQRQYWDKFYQDNPHLKGRERLVNAVVAQEYERLKYLDPQEAQQLLADTIDELIGSQPTERRVLSNRQVTAEPASNPRPTVRRSEPPAEEGPIHGGVSAAIKARAERRRRAQFNISKEEK